MTKNDLKSGMIVKNREGMEYVVFKGHASPFLRNKDVLINVNGSSWMDLINFNDDLLMNGDNRQDLDIVAVYTPRVTIESVAYILKPDKSKLNLLWKREEPKEHTLAEIEKLLGYPVKIVKEKEC